MNYKLQTLASGLRVLTVEMPHLDSATLTVWVKTGSRNEEGRVSGISHFLEHMVFKGSKKRPSAKAISEAVDAIGGEFNAATSKDWTNFYIKVRSAHLETAFAVLADMVLNPLLKPEEIEREKGVIVEEINMYEDTPMLKIGDVFEQLVFTGNSLGRDTAGTAKTVKGIGKSDFVSYRKMQYYPENMLISVVGGVEEEKVISLVKQYFRDLESKKGKYTEKKFSQKQTQPRFKLHPKKKEQAHFILGFLGDGRGYPGRFNQAVLATVLGGGMSSRLFTEVRERRGLAYAVRTSVERFAETGYLATYVGADPKRIEEAIKVTLEEHYQLANKKKPITKKELSKAKEFLKGHLALALEETASVTSFFADQALFLPKAQTPEEIIKKIDAVRVDDIYFEAKRLFVPSRLNLAIIGPYDDSDRFQKLVSSI